MGGAYGTMYTNAAEAHFGAPDAPETMAAGWNDRHSVSLRGIWRASDNVRNG